MAVKVQLVKTGTVLSWPGIRTVIALSVTGWRGWISESSGVSQGRNLSEGWRLDAKVFATRAG